MTSKKEQIEKALGGLLKTMLSYKLSDYNMILTTQEKMKNIDRTSLDVLKKIGCDIQYIWIQDNKINIQFDTSRMRQDLGDLF